MALRRYCSCKETCKHCSQRWFLHFDQSACTWAVIFSNIKALSSILGPVIEWVSWCVTALGVVCLVLLWYPCKSFLNLDSLMYFPHWHWGLGGEMYGWWNESRLEGFQGKRYLDRTGGRYLSLRINLPVWLGGLLFTVIISWRTDDWYFNNILVIPWHLPQTL